MLCHPFLCCQVNERALYHVESACYPLLEQSIVDIVGGHFRSQNIEHILPKHSHSPLPSFLYTLPLCYLNNCRNSNSKDEEKQKKRRFTPPILQQLLSDSGTEQPHKEGSYDATIESWMRTSPSHFALLNVYFSNVLGTNQHYS